MKPRTFLFIILAFAVLGIFDAGYLTYEHFSDAIPPCSTNIFVDCGRVLGSKYAVVFGVPLAVLGLVYYSTLSILVAARMSLVKNISWSEKIWQHIQQRVHHAQRWSLSAFLQDMQLLFTSIGLLTSAYLMYVQIGVIGAICLYCTASAVNSLVLWGLTVWERQRQD